MSKDEKMNVSIVIPTFNEERTIEKTIKSLLYQDYKGKFEIIIIDSESTDKTAEIIEKFMKTNKKIKFISMKDRNIAKARNIGVKNSRGEIIAFIDSGRVAPKDWLKKIINCFKDKDIEGVGGSFKLMNRNGLNMFEKFTALDKICRTISKRRYVDIICTGNAAFRKKVITEIGGFDEKFARRGENSDFCYRIVENGGKILARPDVFVYYNDYYNIEKFIKEHFFNGLYHFFLYLEHKKKIKGDDYGRSSLIIQSFIFLISLFLAFFNPYFILFFVSAFIVLNIRFLKLIAKKERNLLLGVFFLQVLRIAFWILGSVFGLVKLSKLTNYMLKT